MSLMIGNNIIIEDKKQGDTLTMDKYLIHGGHQLKGTVTIDGSKNAVLPIMVASLLAEGESLIENVPDLEDVKSMCILLKLLGVNISKTGDNRLKICSDNIKSVIAPYEVVSRMRASFLVMGPLLARFGKVKIALPGGCRIGNRPIDLHLKGISALGASIVQGHGYIEAKIDDRLKGTTIYLDFPSVGATENILMASVLAEGKTIIENAATEPEIVDLAVYLMSMGAQINGAGTDTITVYGIDRLKAANHSIIPDRIEAGTFMTAAAAAGGDVTVKNVVSSHLKPLIAKLRDCGVKIYEYDDSIRVISDGEIKAVDIKTHPYPGFPTDMQAQMMAMLASAKGTSVIVETIFENRFMHVGELVRMGANIRTDGRTAVVEGVRKLQGTIVKTTDLRAGAALIIAGLISSGKTEVTDIKHIDRGYVKIDEKLRSLGAHIEKA